MIQLSGEYRRPNISNSFVLFLIQIPKKSNEGFRIETLNEAVVVIS